MAAAVVMDSADARRARIEAECIPDDDDDEERDGGVWSGEK